MQLHGTASYPCVALAGGSTKLTGPMKTKSSSANWHVFDMSFFEYIGDSYPCLRWFFIFGSAIIIPSLVSIFCGMSAETGLVPVSTQIGWNLTCRYSLAIALVSMHGTLGNAVSNARRFRELFGTRLRKEVSVNELWTPYGTLYAEQNTTYSIGWDGYTYKNNQKFLATSYWPMNHDGF